jgi:hypothetical protein
MREMCMLTVVNYTTMTLLNYCILTLLRRTNQLEQLIWERCVFL